MYRPVHPPDHQPAAVSLAALPRVDLTPHGILLAVLSGALASGLGHVIWCAALRGLNANRAATVQLSVPPLAALGGIAFLGERLTPRLALATVLILGGIAVTTLQPAWLRAGLPKSWMRSQAGG